MSRIGKMPVVVPAGVEVKIGADVIEVKGPKGQISTPVCNLLSYEMKDGHIIEQGNHEGLLAANGFYASLYNSQFVMPEA